MYIHMFITMENSIKIHYLVPAFLFIALSLFIPFSSAACQENWQCFGWQNCIDNTTARQCFDVNSCMTFASKPAVTDDCSKIFPDCYDNSLNNDETDIDCGGTCMPCQENQFCLKNEDCSTLYCLNSKCSLKQIEQPAIKIISPYYHYGIFFLLCVSFILIIILVIQANNLLSNYSKNKFNLDLSASVKKARKGDLEVSEEIGIPIREERRLKRQLEKIEKNQEKEAKKWMEIDDVKVKLPEKALKKEIEGKESMKRKILKDIKAAYEYSYE